MNITVDWNDGLGVLVRAMEETSTDYLNAIDEGNLSLKMEDPAGEIVREETRLRIAVLNRKLRMLYDRQQIVALATKVACDERGRGILISSLAHDLERQIEFYPIVVKAYETIFGTIGGEG